MKPRVVLATIGSLGDLHPFIALGLALQAHGAEVVIACAAEYRDKVQTAGLNFRAVRPSFDDLEKVNGMDRAQLTAAVLARMDFLIRRVVLPGVRVAYEDMLVVAEGADLVLTSTLCIGARLAAERLAIPWLAVILQPLMFLSAFDPPVMPDAEWLGGVFRRLGPGPTGYALRFLKFALGRMLGPVRALRREIGLPASRLNPLFDGQFSAEGAIGLYSSLLGGIQQDYPRPTSVVGFATFDSEHGDASALPPALREFLDAGAPPLVFTLGSLIVHSPGSFYEASLAAAHRMGKRAVLLVGEPGMAAYAKHCSDTVLVHAYAPHSLLFPRAAAIVHQCGIGTLAQALRSGRPQLLVPFYADQLDNAARARKLGVGRVLPPARYTAPAVIAELTALLTPPGYRTRAVAVREQLAAEDGAKTAARLIWERLGAGARAAAAGGGA